jgi:hypothetical protein
MLTVSQDSLAVLSAAVWQVKIASSIGSAVQRKPDEPKIFEFDKINREFKESGRSKGREPAPERRFEAAAPVGPASLRRTWLRSCTTRKQGGLDIGGNSRFLNVHN